MDGSKYAICDNSTDAFNEDVCHLTMLTMDQEMLDNLNDTEFYDQQIDLMMEEMISTTWVFIWLGLGTWACGWIQVQELILLRA